MSTHWMLMFLGMYSTSGLCEEISFATYGNNDIRFLSTYNVFPPKDKFITYEVLGCYDGKIYFLSQKGSLATPWYIAIMGTNYNSNSVLERNLGGGTSKEILQDVNGPQMNCEIYKRFWFSWYDGILKVGKGYIKDKNVVLSYKMECPFDIEDIGISSHTLINNHTFNTSTTDTNYTTLIPNTGDTLARKYIKTGNCPVFHTLLSTYAETLVHCATLCNENKFCRMIDFNFVIHLCALMTSKVITAGKQTVFISETVSVTYL